jgi:DNA primase
VIDVPRLLTSLGLNAKRQGRKWYAICPNPEHADRKPSWWMLDDEQSERHGSHRCYGCSFGGKPEHLVALVLGCSRAEARAWLRDGDYDVPSFEVTMQQRERTGPRVLTEVPPEVRFGELWMWPPAAQLYLDGRRLGQDTVERWGLGYVPAATKCPLHGRVFIPVREVPGRLRTYQARDFTGKAPTRFLTPAHGPVAILGQEHWPAPERRDTVVVVEGPFDALAVDAAAGVPVAALLGSRLHPWQLTRLVTFRRVVVLTDPDAAGQQAADALRAALARWAQVQLVELPAGTDPAQLWQDDPEALRGVLRSAGEPVDGSGSVVQA